MHRSEAGAIIERITANAGYAITYGYACEAGATIERTRANTCYAITYGYACDCSVILERIGSYHIALAIVVLGQSNIATIANICTQCVYTIYYIKNKIAFKRTIYNIFGIIGNIAIICWTFAKR